MSQVPHHAGGISMGEDAGAEFRFGMMRLPRLDDADGRLPRGMRRRGDAAAWLQRHRPRRTPVARCPVGLAQDTVEPA